MEGIKERAFLMRGEELCNVVPAELAEACLGFLAGVRWITEPHLVRFWRDDTWESLPVEWVEWLETVSFFDLPALLADPARLEDSVPEGVMRFARTCKHPSLDRAVGSDVENRALSVPPALLHMRGMTKKKEHEVSYMGGEVKHLCEALETRSVVDVGAGSAYLSHSLYMQCGIRSVGIEGNSSHTDGALSRFENLKKRVLAYNAKHDTSLQLPFPSIELITCCIDSNDPQLVHTFEVSTLEFT